MKYGVDVKKIRGIQKWINERIGGMVKGHYGGIFRIGKELYAMHTDGVGTKVLVAQELNKFDTVGIDAVAMNANDLVCVGARPLYGVDYLAVAEEDEWLIKEIIKGLLKGAEEAGIEIVGGETAVMPDIIKGWQKPFDLAFTAFGKVENLITGEKIKIGDVVVGFESSGLHSNGYTLARKVLDVNVWGEEMLKPTKIYVRPIMEIVEKNLANGIAHITGGAYTKLLRLGKGFEINAIEPSEIFLEMYKKIGSWREMYRTFNMGIGMVVVANERNVDGIMKISKKHKIKAHVIGKVIAKKAVYVNVGGERIRVDFEGIG
ncbi:MAG: phosphoribosylformylglycinamidine cyclo-ligase [Candidatus Anstonellales archaeon]